jgi:hypothetical protein
VDKIVGLSGAERVRLAVLRQVKNGKLTQGKPAGQPELSSRWIKKLMEAAENHDVAQHGATRDRLRICHYRKGAWASPRKANHRTSSRRSQCLFYRASGDQTIEEGD